MASVSALFNGDDQNLESFPNCYSKHFEESVFMWRIASRLLLLISLRIRIIDRGIKNRFSWKWLEDKDFNDDSIRLYSENQSALGLPTLGCSSNTPPPPYLELYKMVRISGILGKNHLHP
jgi:hypothetical protein